MQISVNLWKVVFTKERDGKIPLQTFCKTVVRMMQKYSRVQWEPPALHQGEQPERVLSASERFLTSFSVRGVGAFRYAKERERNLQGIRERERITQQGSIRLHCLPLPIMWFWNLAWSICVQTKMFWIHFISSYSTWEKQQWVIYTKPLWSTIQQSPIFVRLFKEGVDLRLLLVQQNDGVW